MCKLTRTPERNRLSDFPASLIKQGQYLSLCYRYQWCCCTVGAWLIRAVQKLKPLAIADGPKIFILYIVVVDFYFKVLNFCLSTTKLVCVKRVSRPPSLSNRYVVPKPVFEYQLRVYRKIPLFHCPLLNYMAHSLIDMIIRFKSYIS